MKKIILGLAFLAMVSGPIVAQADTTVQYSYTVEQKQELIRLITQLIQILQAQLNAMLAQQANQPIMDNNSTAPLSPEPQNIPLTAPAPAATLQIVSPLAGKGLGRQYVASPDIKDESNYIDIGLIVTNPDGSVNTTATVNVTATDSSQNKEIVGTGTFWGNPHNVYYYPFEYQFKTPGDHTITFTVLGVTQSVTVTAK